MKIREKCLTGNPKPTTDGVGVSGFSRIHQRSSLDVVSGKSWVGYGLCNKCTSQMLTGTELLD